MGDLQTGCCRRPEGYNGTPVIIETSPEPFVDEDSKFHAPSAKNNVGPEECTRLPIPEGCLISECANGRPVEVKTQEPEVVD